MSEKKNDSLQMIKDVGPYLGLGVQLAATIVIMILIGDWLDKKYQTSPIYVLVFGLFGIFAGMYNLLKSVVSLEKKKQNEPKK
jgi:F0F1-type ATP synthase assembly protein I